MGWKPDHKPIKAKYSPYMSAKEKRHKARVELEPCFGCGAWNTVAHHTLLKFPEKRWRRDHRFLLPVCERCHTLIHDELSEPLWLADAGKNEDDAISYIKRLWDASEEDERRAA